MEQRLETKEDEPVVDRLNACPHPEMVEELAHGPVPQEVQVIVVVKQVVLPVPHPEQFAFKVV